MLNPIPIVMAMVAMSAPAFAQQSGRTPQAEAEYVPLLSERFFPGGVNEDFYETRGSREWRRAAEHTRRSFVQLPASGQGFRALGNAEILWGRSEVVYGFMQAARNWSARGGAEIQVYALSPRDPVARRIDNAEGTFWASHLYGARDSEHRRTAYAERADVFHVAGCAMDIREFTRDALNERMLAALEQGTGIESAWIYDMMTLEEIAYARPVSRSPLHVHFRSRGGADRVPPEYVTHRRQELERRIKAAQRNRRQ